MTDFLQWLARKGFYIWYGPFELLHCGKYTLFMSSIKCTNDDVHFAEFYFGEFVYTGL